MPGMARRPSTPPTDSRPVVVTSRMSGAAATMASVDSSALSTTPISVPRSVPPAAAMTASMPLPLPNTSCTFVAPQVQGEHLRSAGGGDGGVGPGGGVGQLVLERGDQLLAPFGHGQRVGDGADLLGHRLERRLVGQVDDADAGRAHLIEHLGRPGVVVGEDDGRFERQDRLGHERPLVADLRRGLGLGRVRRRDVGGHDLVAQPEGVDDLGQVAVDGDDPLDGAGSVDRRWWPPRSTARRPARWSRRRRRRWRPTRRRRRRTPSLPPPPA